MDKNSVCLNYGVFLNYPYDDAYLGFSDAIHFAVVASNRLPVCATDLSLPDTPRLSVVERLVEQCRYSVHDLSRVTGEGEGNYARLNMALELGMAMQRRFDDRHHYAICISTKHVLDLVASDLKGSDPICYNESASGLCLQVHAWLANYHPDTRTFNHMSKDELCGYFDEYRTLLMKRGSLDHCERQLLMFELTEAKGVTEWLSHAVSNDMFRSLYRRVKLGLQ